MTEDLHALYEQTVLDHGRRPRNRRAIAGACTGEGRNPLCGDRVVVYVTIAHGIVVDASFEGSACAIVVASASLMTEAITGHGIAAARELSGRFRGRIVQPIGTPLEDLGPLAALGGVRRFPVRIRCAVLPWQALETALTCASRC